MLCLMARVQPHSLRSERLWFMPVSPSVCIEIEACRQHFAGIYEVLSNPRVPYSVFITFLNRRDFLEEVKRSKYETLLRDEKPFFLVFLTMHAPPLNLSLVAVL